METTQVLKYCLYARKSSESDEKQAMSIDSQVKEMLALAERENFVVTDIRKESHSAKESGQRPVFMKLLHDIRLGQFDAILTWTPDRLSRNAGDLGSLVDLMDQQKLQLIRCHSQSFSNNPNEKFLLMILCSQAKLENDNRAINVKRGIRNKCEMGWRPCPPPVGYFNRSMGGLKDIIVDPERAPFVIEMFERAAKGESGRRIQNWLNRKEATTRKGKSIPLSMIYKTLKHPFYYGEFEYPVGSGKWYKGAHTPLVTKELWDQVQIELAVPQKSKWGSKSFPFKRLMRCATCGASIIGEDKYRKQWDGSKIRHVYYHCSPR